MDNKARLKRKRSFRAKFSGSKKRPRLNIFRSSKHIYASLIDDVEGKTIIWSNERGIKPKEKSTKSDKAFLVGEEIARKATKKGFKKVIFDRSGYLYHGRVKKLAEGAREGGLSF